MPNPREIRRNGFDIYTVNFAEYLPESLKKDPKIRAIAQAVAKEALAVSEEIKSVLIYCRIDELPEELIDILAYDMHVDWYDYSYPLDIKRDIVKSSVKVHKKMGTKYAVETALKSIYKTTTIKEWFEYGGEPYWFKVVINIGNEGITGNTIRDIWEKIYFYKNLRSHCAGIFCTLRTKGNIWVKPYAGLGISLKVKAYLVDKLNEKDCEVKLLSKPVVGETLKIKAELIDNICIRNNTTILSKTVVEENMKIKTDLVREITMRTDKETALSYQRIKNMLVVRKGQ